MPTPPLFAALRRWLDRLRSGSAARLIVAPGPAGAAILLARPGPIIERVVVADLRADGLLGPEEMSARLGALLADLPSADAVLVLPPGLTHSQILHPADDDARSPAALAADAVGHAPGGPDLVAATPLPGRGRAVWVGVARADAVDAQLRRCGLPAGRIERVIGSDAALAAAFHSQPERPPLAILVDLGRASGQLLVLEHARPALAADLDWGMDRLRSAVAADLGRPESEAATLLTSPGLPSPTTPRLAAVLRGLGLAVEGLLADFARERGLDRDTLAAAPRWLSGPGLTDPAVHALIARAAGGPAPRAWPALSLADGSAWSPAEALPALGAARLAFATESGPDFSPAPLRAIRRRERLVAALHLAAAGLAIAALFAGLARLDERQENLAARRAETEALRQARAAVPALIAAQSEREAAYLAALPALYLQKRTRDFAAALRQLGETRADDAYWFAVVADAETYQAGALPSGTPAAAPETQRLPGLLARPSGLVVELSFRPGGPDPLARVDALLATLRDSGGFARVDLVPARDRQAGLADPAVYAAEGAGFALRLDAPAFVGPIPATALPPPAGGLFSSP